MIGGFEEPSEGRIFLGDRDVVGLPPYKRDVNTVFQSYALFPHLSIFENVAFGLRRRGVGGEELRRRVDEALDLVALHGVRHAQAETALRWPAAACRSGTRARQPPARAAPRRAARRARPQAPQADAARAEAHPARGRHHVRPRHARPGGGDDDGRHDRGHEPRPDRAARAAGGAVRDAADGVRRGLPRRLESPAGHRGGHRRRAPRQRRPSCERRRPGRRGPSLPVSARRRSPWARAAAPTASRAPSPRRRTSASPRRSSSTRPTARFRSSRRTSTPARAFPRRDRRSRSAGAPSPRSSSSPDEGGARMNPT